MNRLNCSATCFGNNAMGKVYLKWAQIKIKICKSFVSFEFFPFVWMFSEAGEVVPSDIKRA